MNTVELIYREAKGMPEFEAREVLDFIASLKGKRPSLEDETAYLMREPANARDLLQAVRELREGRGYQLRELLPDD
uniref:Uncharacterized protein n=2 Tax=unclassified Candidatus Kentrum TaxID=2643149 RepID=A0A451AD86_9GAMM|nr:MAG: hypothetical protein BECKLPF1236B_GA0070989_10997 [Candidatus Kentron sp. LPFa]VFK63998.1 MAG: hypothetical protein BECKUNK1418G_GA0071005_104021 [Candidatus Kentron sp. UNK]VFK70997.1 MAG: hypothetical protein BECKUNK1418H_GA0071006_104622 [Candidatus Kentron sp. UNK]